MASTVLIVEDDALNMKLLSQLLVSHGFDVIQSIDGTDAIALAREHSPDLIVMDIRLPNVSGLEYTKALKADEYLKNIPVLAVSAFAMKGDENQILEAGCDGYIAKPIRIHYFLDEIRRFINVEPFRLTANLITGHAEIDADHKRLVLLMDEFVDYFEGNGNTEKDNKITEMYQVLASHFKREESIMEALGDKALDAHKEDHRAILDRYNTVKENAANDGYKSDYIEELKGILVDDMIASDMNFKDYLLEINYQG